MKILRKFWSEDDYDDGEFIIITENNKYTTMNKEEAVELYQTSFNVILQLRPLLASSGIEIQIPED